MVVPGICKEFQCMICKGDKGILQSPDMNLVDSSFRIFLKTLNIFVIKSSHSIKDIMLQPFYPLAVYALASDTTSSIYTTLELANHEPNKTN